MRWELSGDVVEGLTVSVSVELSVEPVTGEVSVESSVELVVDGVLVTTDSVGSSVEPEVEESTRYNRCSGVNGIVRRRSACYNRFSRATSGANNRWRTCHNRFSRFSRFRTSTCYTRSRDSIKNRVQQTPGSLVGS